jgi:hypothetical protein
MKIDIIRSSESIIQYQMDLNQYIVATLFVMNAITIRNIRHLLIRVLSNNKK